MKILVACTHQNIVGGVETYLRDMIPALRARGHAVALLASHPAGPGGAPVAPSDVLAWSLSRADRAAVFRAVEDWGPDVAYAHGLESLADEENVVARFPTVLFAHGHAATCVGGSRTHAFPSYRPCGRRLGPACLAVYLPRRCGGLSPLTMIRLYLQARRRADLLPRYAGVVVGSRYMANEYQDHGVPADRLHLIPLFPTGHDPDPGPSARPGAGRVLMVGRLYQEKGTHLLVDAVGRAAARLGRPLTLVVAGDGPERPMMEAQAAKGNVPAEFHGWVGPDRRVDLMRSADVLAVPSPCPETFGLVGVEAGCVGLPAVGFAVGGIPDWLIPGVSGELAPADPPTAGGLADALVRALADPVRLHALSAGAWETARRFTRDRHVASLDDVLACVAAGVPAATPGPTARRFPLQVRE